MSPRREPFYYYKSNFIIYGLLLFGHCVIIECAEKVTTTMTNQAVFGFKQRNARNSLQQQLQHQQFVDFSYSNQNYLNYVAYAGWFIIVIITTLNCRSQRRDDSECYMRCFGLNLKKNYHIFLMLKIL
jgi:hypothetical protein